MATVLKKDLIRETNVKKDDKELIITLTENQEIELRQKHSHDEPLKISISDLYDKLIGKGDDISDEKKTVKVKPKKVGDDVISLTELRAHNAIAKLDYKEKVKFENIITNLMGIK